MRAMGVVKCPPGELFKRMHTCKMRKEWDSTLEQLGYLQNVGKNAYVMYQQYKKSNNQTPPPREFLTNFLCNQDPDGSILHVASSTDCKFNYCSSFTRGSIHLQGSILYPHGDNQTLLTWVQEVDYKGGNVT